MTGVAHHRAALDAELGRLGLNLSDWPEVLTDSRLSDEARLSGVLVLLQQTEQNVPITSNVVVVGEEDDSLDVWGRPREPWVHLVRVKLPWTAPTATLALAFLQRGLAVDERAAALALRGAKQVCDQGIADTSLLDTLRGFVEWLGSDVMNRELRDLRQQALRAVAAAAPPDLLDLSLVCDEDAWGPAAREAARALPSDDVAPLVRLLGDLGQRRPSQRWLRQVADALQPPGATALLESWLTLAAEADVVPLYPGYEAYDVGKTVMGTLFLGTNTDVVRAAVAATTALLDAVWPPRLLGELALRGSAHNGLPGFTEALALKVASASVDALITRDTPEDRQVLASLLEDLQRKDLLRKVGQALGRADEAETRTATLAHAKAQAVRRKASRGSEKARAAMDSHLRQHLGKTLRSLGMRGGPRSWHRRHQDRVDKVVVGVTTGWVADGEVNDDVHLVLTYGTRFDAAHPTDAPEGMLSGFERLDIDLHHELPGGASPERLQEVAALIADTVVPFLDTLAQYDMAKRVLERDEGVPAGAEAFMGPAPNLVRSESLGLLALAAGDRTTARHHLARVHAAVGEMAEAGDTGYERSAACDRLGFWADRVREADDLP